MLMLVNLSTGDIGLFALNSQPYNTWGKFLYSNSPFLSHPFLPPLFCIFPFLVPLFTLHFPSLLPSNSSSGVWALAPPEGSFNQSQDEISYFFSRKIWHLWQQLRRYCLNLVLDMEVPRTTVLMGQHGRREDSAICFQAGSEDFPIPTLLYPDLLISL